MRFYPETALGKYALANTPLTRHILLTGRSRIQEPLWVDPTRNGVHGYTMYASYEDD